MPFQMSEFQKQIELSLNGGIKDLLFQKVEIYSLLTTSKQKSKCIIDMTKIMDENLDLETRKQIMESCGRKCIGKSLIKKALILQKQSVNFDDLLNKLNEAHIGGGHLRRKDNIIFAQYDKCYCGSVNKSSDLFSDTYCHCSCGWYKQLFEVLLQQTVEVELKSSIICGNDVCLFQIHL